jgi:hypothetical protein
VHGSPGRHHHRGHLRHSRSANRHPRPVVRRALPRDIATTGGAGAFLAGLNQFWGFLTAGEAGAAIMELTGVQRRRGRDVSIGVIVGAALGAAALFLYLGTLISSMTVSLSR